MPCRENKLSMYINKTLKKEMVYPWTFSILRAFLIPTKIVVIATTLFIDTLTSFKPHCRRVSNQATGMELWYRNYLSLPAWHSWQYLASKHAKSRKKIEKLEATFLTSSNWSFERMMSHSRSFAVRRLKVRFSSKQVQNVMS